MCISVPLPRVDFKERMLRGINVVNNPSDVVEAALNDTPLDGDFLRREAHRVKRVKELGPLGSYEEIFTTARGIARQEDRLSTPPPLDVHVFVNRWFQSVKTVPDPEHEIGDPPKGISWHFEDLVRDHLPTKLDLESWVGEMVFEKLSNDRSTRLGTFYQWSPWMGTKEAQTTPPPAGFEFFDKYFGFVGTAGEGRLVWRKDQWGVPKNTDIAHRRFNKKIEGKIRIAEDALVCLSVRIANYLAHWLVNKYAQETMHLRDGVRRERLTSTNIAEAVIEILGDEWFELPFDVEGKLKSWKHKREWGMSEGHFLHIIRP